MIIRKNILNIIESGLILFAIYGIGIEYSGKYSSYRSEWNVFNYEYTRIIIDFVVLGIFALRIFQISRMIIGENVTELSRKKFLLISSIYLILMLPDFYAYFCWFYYTQLPPAGILLFIYTLPLIIWTYKMTKKQIITAP